ncbi:hypothetical protein D3C80_1824930 [compost metagenome]
MENRETWVNHIPGHQRFVFHRHAKLRVLVQQPGDQVDHAGVELPALRPGALQDLGDIQLDGLAKRTLGHGLERLEMLLAAPARCINRCVSHVTTIPITKGSSMP